MLEQIETNGISLNAILKHGLLLNDNSFIIFSK